MTDTESKESPAFKDPNASPYSAFTSTEKRVIVALSSYAAWFSTLTSFIYYPAIHQLAQSFSVSVNKINLTVTSYMSIATIAPALVGDAADSLGRRPIYGLILSLYIGTNIAIVLADSYPALLGLRFAQAPAISGEQFSASVRTFGDVWEAARLPRAEAYGIIAR